MKILVTGARGQLGSEIRELVTNGEATKDLFTFVDREELDLADRAAIERVVGEGAFDAIVNCAAYTAVDKAESEPELADAVNHRAVETLASLAKELGIRMIQISTDYVFDGTSYRPYVESDPVHPQGVYGATKLAGEEAMLRIAPPGGLIIRTSWVYSSYGANFVKTMLRLGRERERLGVIFDQVGTPTYARDLARAILHILQQPEPEAQNEVQIYHFSNEGVCSWYDFAKAIFEMAEMEIRVDPIRSEAYPTPAKRPHYSVLDKSKIKEAYDLEIPYWRDSLRDCLETIRNANQSA